MLIRTKYNVGDPAWFMHENVAKMRKVQALKCYVSDIGKHNTEYYMGMKRPDNWEEWLPEHRIHKTKEDLLITI